MAASVTYATETRREAVYRALLRRLLQTTAQQLTNYGTWVSQTRSWYKKLPHNPPGEAFVFYLDPHVMQLPREDGEGHVIWRPVITFQRRIAADASDVPLAHGRSHPLDRVAPTLGDSGDALASAPSPNTEERRTLPSQPQGRGPYRALDQLGVGASGV